MRLSNGRFSLWTYCLNPFIFSVIFRIVIRVECTEYRTFDVIPDGSGRIAQVVEVEAVPTPQAQFASRRGSLDIRSQYWSRTRRDPEYPEESDGEVVGLTEEEAERRPYVQVDRTGKEHTVTINMPRMEGRSRNHLIKKFVLQPVIQYVVQYDKDSQIENGEEAQASTNFEDYEGYQGQEKMVKSHGRSVDRFFNGIDANFESYWGNDGKGGEYQEGGDSVSGGYQNGGGGDESTDGGNSQGGYDGGYDNGGNFGASQSQSGSQGGGGYDNSGASQSGFDGGSTSSQGGYNNANNNGNVGEGMQSSTAFNSGGSSGGAQFTGFHSSSGGQNENAVAHNFGFTIEGGGGYSSTNQFHQPPDVNAFVSSGGYGVPPQPSSSMTSSNNNAGVGVQTSGYSGGMQGGMNLANAAQITTTGGMGQMFNPMQNLGYSVPMNGIRNSAGVSSAQAGGNGANTASFGSMNGGNSNMMAPTSPITSGMGSGMNVGMSPSTPTTSLNSLYGVPGMTSGKPLGIEMMMNAMKGGPGAIASTANSVMGMNLGQMTPVSMPGAVGTGMMNAPQIQSAPMMPAGVMPQAVGMGSPLTPLAASAMGGTGMSGVTSTGATASLPMGMAHIAPGQMGTTGISGMSNVNGISMGFGNPGPIGMVSSTITSGGGMTMGQQPPTSYGVPSSSASSSSSGSNNNGGYPAESYGPPAKESSRKPPSSMYGPPKDSPGGYGGGGGSTEDDSADDPMPPRGKGKKPVGGGKSKGRGGRGGKSLLSSLPLPKIPQSIGGHLSFMFSTGVGKGRRNRGGGMTGGGGAKPGGENSKSVSKEQNGNRTSLNHTSNQEDILGDVVDLLPVDADVLTPNQAAIDDLPEMGSNITDISVLDEETTTARPKPETLKEVEPVPKPSNKILIATVPPPTKSSLMPRLPNSILIATVPSFTTSAPLPPPSSIKSVQIATPEPTIFTSKLTSSPTPSSIAIITTTTTLPVTTPVPLQHTSSKSILSSTTIEPTSSPNPSSTSSSTTSLPPLVTSSSTAPSPPVEIMPPNKTQSRQGKNLSLPKVLIATPTSPSSTEIILTPMPTRPHPTPSISIEIDPIQDYINHNLRNNVLTVNNNSPISYNANPIHRPVTRPNIQAYYAQHDFQQNPVKIEQFDPWIYDALQAAFMPQSHNDLLEGRKRKRSRFPITYRHPFPFPPPTYRHRSWLRRFSNLLSKRVDGNDTSINNGGSLAVIPSARLSLQEMNGQSVGRKSV